MSGTCCALTQNPLLLSRSATFSPQPPTPLHFPTTPPFNRFPPPFAQLRFRHSRLSALSGDGSGGSGGNGGDGGWNFGDNEADDGGGTWSFLSW